MKGALGRPEPSLTDEVVRLEPLDRSLIGEFGWVVDGDEGIRRFTFIPTNPAPDFLDNWLKRYEDGWENESCAGFAIRDAADGSLLGFAGIVRLDLEQRQGEIGYALAPAARGRGSATRAVELVTRWAFAELGLERAELRISVENEASSRVAERAGYRLDGVLRSLAFKEGLRTDTAVWSRLQRD